MRRGFSASIAAVLAILASAEAAAADSAVVLMYHRFGEDQYPSTNIRLEQFEAQIAELRTGGYHVLPLPELVSAIAEGRALPDKAVAITVDDGYASIHAEAWPRLKAAGFPFTVFVSTDPIDRGLAGFMSWDQLREMRDAGVILGAHSRSHPHLPEISAELARAELARSNARFEEELGAAPKLFAYPYGEASSAVMEMAKRAGYVAAFGQQSGVLHKSAETYYLPRFALNEQYGEMSRFRLVAQALPIPADDLSPEDPFVLVPNPPLVGFTLGDGIGDTDRLACFASTEGRLAVQRLGPRIELRLKEKFPPGRSRINCTLPTADGRWRWLGMQFTVPGGR